jgi:hypothetical protein
MLKRGRLRFGLVVALLGVALAVTAASASFSSYVRPAVGTGGEGFGCVPPFHFCALPPSLRALVPPPPFVFIFHAAFAFLCPGLVPCLRVLRRRLVRFLHLFINFYN